MRTKKKVRIKWGRFIPFCLICLALIVGAALGIKALIKPPCEHVYEEGVCTLCGEACKHDFSEGYCKTCGSVDPNFVFPDEIIDFSMLCGGDTMAHITNLRSQYVKGSGTTAGEPQSGVFKTDGKFDFTDNFQYIKPYVQAADLAFVNLETTFAGGPYYNGNMSAFNAPDELGEALKDAGFDVVFTCNNHSIDQGISGVKRTVEVLRNQGFTVVGSRLSESENRSSVVEVKGVKVGVVAYTYETSEASGSGHSLNGKTLNAEGQSLLNTFRFTGSGASNAVCSNADKEAIKAQFDWCKANGAEVLVAYFHWDKNNEYVLKATALEKDLAQFAADCGADVVFGSHPHRVQTMEVLTAKDEQGRDKQVPVYYSLGNLISNQNRQSFADLGDPNGACTEEELLGYVEISYNRTQDTVTFNKISAIPLWVARYHSSAKTGKYWEYRIFPLVGDYRSNADLKATKWVDRADTALKNITEVIGAQYVYK